MPPDLIEVEFVRQAYPMSGGFVQPAGAKRKFTREQLRDFPKGSYRVIAPPTDKQMQAEAPKRKYRTK